MKALSLPQLIMYISCPVRPTKTGVMISQVATKNVSVEKPTIWVYSSKIIDTLIEGLTC